MEAGVVAVDWGGGRGLVWGNWYGMEVQKYCFQLFVIQISLQHSALPQGQPIAVNSLL